MDLQPEVTEEVGRIGNASATVNLCQCEDGLFRYSVAMGYGMSGFSGPISARTSGYPTAGQAKTAAIEELVRRLPSPQPSPTEASNDQLVQLVLLLKAALAQPSLFELLT